jgi:hypothetical protein
MMRKSIVYEVSELLLLGVVHMFNKPLYSLIVAAITYKALTGKEALAPVAK